MLLYSAVRTRIRGSTSRWIVRLGDLESYLGYKCFPAIVEFSPSIAGEVLDVSAMN